MDSMKTAVVGLGYVGLPLALCFAKRYTVTAFDVNTQRIAELQQQRDHTNEVEPDEFATQCPIEFTADPLALAGAQFIVVTVPTPVDADHRPDLHAVKAACRSVGPQLSKGATVVFESTVFPGCTEEVCIPILEQTSGLRCNTDFFVGYSPERINPGDKERRIDTIVKVTSGSTPAAAEAVDQLYAAVIDAGTFKAASIKVAEAAKVIENTQRDLNIALINELAIIFKRMDIDTHDVLAAAQTKWNFLPFKPGLVGGHCIGVDPYYLTHKAERLGYRPEVILAGRRINDNMPSFVAGRIVKAMLKKHIDVVGAKVLMLGVTFKENCPDIRNSKVFDLIRELADYDIQVDCYDPVADAKAVTAEYGATMVDDISADEYDAAIFAVAHTAIVASTDQIKPRLKARHVIYDLKGMIAPNDCDERL